MISIEEASEEVQELKAKEDEAEEAQALFQAETNKYGASLLAAANDPDLGITKEDLGKIKEEAKKLPDPMEQLVDKSSMKMNAEGGFSIKSKVTLRKMDFNKIRDKEISVKNEMVKKIEA